MNQETMSEGYIHPDMWPLKRGDTLSNHDWFPFYGHRFLSSGFLAKAVMEGRRADVGTALVLWSEAMRQDPAGTLPNDDLELASLARFSSVEDWMAVRAGVMHGWVPVLVEDDRSAEQGVRLGHAGFLQQVVEQMHRRKQGRDGAREASRLAVRKSRIRKKLLEMRIPDHVATSDQVILGLAEYFEQSDLYVTPDNLRAALSELFGYSGDVTPFNARKGGK